MENRSGFGKADEFQISVREAVKYIDKYEEAVQEMIRDFDSEQTDLYQIYAIDDRVLSKEEAEIYQKQTVKSSIDVPYRAKLLMQVTKDLVQLKILVSEACGKSGIKYNQNIFIKIIEGEYVDNIFDSMGKEMVILGRLGRLAGTERTMHCSSHMSPEDEIINYQYPVVRTTKLLADQALAGRIVSDMRQKSRKLSEMVEEQIDHIFIDYTPRFDIHAEWHNWTVNS